MFQKKTQSVESAKSFMFKQYRLTIAMFLAGTCALLMAMSISHAGNPNVRDPQDTIIEDLQGATMADEKAAQCEGDCDTDMVLCNGSCDGEKDCKVDCLKQYQDCISACK